MRWRSVGSIVEKKMRDNEQWHHWFAWHPVRVDDEVVWLETLERKINRYWVFTLYCEFKEYRRIDNE